MPLGRLLPAYQVPQQQRDSRAMLVPAIRKAVHGWRGAGYPGATDVSRRLLAHWFETDHPGSDGEDWHYYYCQREAIETLIYLYEVIKSRRLRDLAENFEPNMAVRPAEDRFARYVFKMATGSGKTKVMSLAIVWSYFNALVDPENYSKTFLVIAPNVIVYQRLLDAFENGAIFRSDPLMPKDWDPDWQFGVVTRDNPGAPASRGTLYLTNVHQLYDQQSRSGSQEPDVMTAVLGPAPRSSVTAGETLRSRILSQSELMVLNDEAHHLHNDELKWRQLMDDFHRNLSPSGLMAQLDFTATPKHTDGRLFREIVVDYPLAQAMQDQIVKRPILGELSGARENETAENAAVRHRDKLTAGIQKWKAVPGAAQRVGEEANAVRNDRGYKGSQRTLLSGYGRSLSSRKEASFASTRTPAARYPNRSVSQKELDDAASRLSRRWTLTRSPYYGNRLGPDASRGLGREECGRHSASPCVHAQQRRSCPSRLLGRGLRRMWPMAAGGDMEQVIVIEHQAFRKFWDNEIKRRRFGNRHECPWSRFMPEVKTVHGRPPQSRSTTSPYQS